MTGERLSDGDIECLVQSYRTRDIDERIVGLAEGDLKAGFKEEKVRLYVASNMDMDRAKAMSEAIHEGMSLFLLKKVADRDEYVIRLALKEFKGGMSDAEIAKVVTKKAPANTMEQMFRQMKSDMTRTEDEAVPEETEKRQASHDNEEPAREAVSYKPEDIAAAMEPVLARLMDGRLNKEIDRLEKRVEELTSDLASSAGVIKSKEDEIGRLREEMVKMKEEKVAVGTKTSEGTPPSVSETQPPARADKKKETDAGDAGGVVSDKPEIQLDGSYQTVLTTPDGKMIPVQIEGTSTKKPRGVLAMAARLFSGTPSQKSLLNMLIDSRLKPAQLREIKRAKDNHFSDEELKDLIECDLPAEEMAGIIDVIISDR